MGHLMSDMRHQLQPHVRWTTLTTTIRERVSPFIIIEKAEAMDPAAFIIHGDRVNKHLFTRQSGGQWAIYAAVQITFIHPAVIS